MKIYQFIILTAIIIFLTAGIFTAYYFLIAQPKIKADCLNAATRVRNITVYRGTGGQTVDFNEEKYNECIKVF